MFEDFIRIVNAAKNFKIKDDFEFISFDDITQEDVENGDSPETIDIWAAVKISYNGKMPESYKALNLMIGDWVEKNLSSLTEVLHKELRGHFEEHYPESNSEDLESLDESVVWTDQLDYMPAKSSEDEKSLVIEIELVLHAEPVGEEDA
jgi:hypothetical protein